MKKNYYAITVCTFFFTIRYSMFDGVMTMKFLLLNTTNDAANKFMNILLKMKSVREAFCKCISPELQEECKEEKFETSKMPVCILFRNIVLGFIRTRMKDTYENKIKNALAFGSTTVRPMLKVLHCHPSNASPSAVDFHTLDAPLLPDAPLLSLNLQPSPHSSNSKKRRAPSFTNPSSKRQKKITIKTNENMTMIMQ